MPQRKAEPATKDNIEAFEQRRAELEKAQAEAYSSAQARAEKLEGAVITVTSKAGTEGKLFGSIGTEDIRSAVSEAIVAVEKKEIRMPDGPLRTIGEHEIALHLHADVDATVTVQVVAEAE